MSKPKMQGINTKAVRKTLLLLLCGLVFLVFGSPVIADEIFAPHTRYPTGDGATSVVIGDFDGDGMLDLAVANSGSDDVSVLLGNGDGTFAPETSYPAGDWPNSIAIGDLDGDGRLDLAVANLYSDDVSVLLGNGNGSFAPHTRYPAGDGPNSVAIGEFDGDGQKDLAVAHNAFLIFNMGGVLVLHGNGEWSRWPRLAPGVSVHSVAVGDFDADGRQDLAVATRAGGIQQTGHVSVALGTGDGSFAPHTRYPAGYGPNSVAIGDFDGDGRKDLAVANAWSDDVSVLLGNGDGSFSAQTRYPAGYGPNSVAIGDFDGDGRKDLAVANAWSDDVSVLLGNGDGSFSAQTRYLAGYGPRSVAVGDFDGDGRQDLAVANAGSDDVSVLLNQLPMIIEIDIKPGGYPDSINPRSRGVVPVALLGSEEFDVVDVDVSTLRFGPAEAAPSYHNHRADVNFDAIMDRVVHFRTPELGIQCGDTEATLTGSLLNGKPFEGSDSITTVGCRSDRTPAQPERRSRRVRSPRVERPVDFDRRE